MPTLTIRTHRALALAVALLVVPAARLHAQPFDVQQLRLVPNQQDNYFGLQSARTLPRGEWEAGLVLDYANDPLVLVNSRGDRALSLVGDQLSADLLFAYGVRDNFEVGLDVPFVLAQDGEGKPTVTSASGANAGFGIGDLHVSAKWSLWNHDTAQSPGGTGMALGLDAQLPTGKNSDFQGEGFRIEPRAIFDYVFPRSLRLSAQLGYLVRPKAKLLGTEVNDTLTLGVGADLPLDPEQRWHIIGEADTKVSVLAGSVNAEEVPVEMLFGWRYYHASGVMLEAGGGFGANVGFGTPDYRVVLGVTYRPPHDQPDRDLDHDGLVGNDDKCPNDPEDGDGYEDEDGCPDPDNDQDGVLDVVDRCPLVAEDKDGFEDQDGCPDIDNDHDGLLDPKDACPDQAEDADGFKDADGCPDPDNDGDGLLDAKDSCPDVAEDYDEFEDQDGCPEAGAPLVKLTCEKIEISERVYFDTASDNIQERSFPLLVQVAGVLTTASYVKKMRIEGHTDDRGNDKYNLDLSARRAAAVVRFLVDHGIAAERLTSEGLGKTKPIASNADDAGRSQNRRVEFVIVEQDSRCGTP